MAKKTDSNTSKPAAPVKPAAPPTALVTAPTTPTTPTKPAQPIAKAAAKKKPAAKSAKAALKKKPTVKKTAKPAAPVYSRDDVALRAYFIAEKRHALGLHGSEHGDWLEAERQLAAENGKSRRLKKA